MVSDDGAETNVSGRWLAETSPKPGDFRLQTPSLTKRALLKITGGQSCSHS